MNGNELLPSWKKLLKDHWQQIDLGNVNLYEAEEDYRKRALSLVFRAPLNSGKQIKNTLDKIIPFSFKNGFYFSPIKVITLLYSGRLKSV